jgi:hypothetical protein
MLQTSCTCGAELQYPEAHAGKKLRCPRCQAIVETPAPAPAAPPVEQIMTAELLPSGPANAEAFQAGGSSTLPGRPALNDRGPWDRPVPTQTSGKAVWSLILGIGTFCLSFFTAIPSIILGILAIKDTNRNPRLGGSGMAVAGIVISCVMLIVNFVSLALVVPAVQKVREAAARAQDQNNIKQIILGMHGAHDTYKKLPPAYGPLGNGPPAGNHSAFVHLLPFVEQGALHRMPNMFPQGPFQPGNTVIPVYLSPTDPSIQEMKNAGGRMSYAGNIRVFSKDAASAGLGKPVPLADVMPGGLRLFEITDGTSNTLMIGGRFSLCGAPAIPTLFDSLPPTASGSPFLGAGTHAILADDGPALDRTFQVAPTQANCRPDASVYGHTSFRTGMSVGLCDGSVRFISNTIQPNMFQAFICPNDGQAVGDF